MFSFSFFCKCNFLWKLEWFCWLLPTVKWWHTLFTLFLCSYQQDPIITPVTSVHIHNIFLCPSLFLCLNVSDGCVSVFCFFLFCIFFPRANSVFLCSWGASCVEKLHIIINKHFIPVVFHVFCHENPQRQVKGEKIWWSISKPALCCFFSCLYELRMANIFLHFIHFLLNVIYSLSFWKALLLQ